MDWLDERRVAVLQVDRGVVATYITEFAAESAANPAGRRPRTVNHRLSVLGSFFAYLAAEDEDGWGDRPNPVPLAASPMVGGRGVPGRDAVRRGRRGELRRRVPRELPRRVEPEVAVALIEAAKSARDQALLTLLWRTGQRVGENSSIHGQHGVLGMRLGDLDRQARMITVRLKGARDEHRVPVSDDFWPLFARYVTEERGLGAPEEPAWVGFRRGRGRPLSYAAFESSLRHVGAKVGVRVTAHMFRHALAQALVDTAGPHVAQEVLGHAHLSTTIGVYARVDERAMVDALARTADLFDLAAAAARRPAEGLPAGGFVFGYSDATLAELDAISAPQGEA